MRTALGASRAQVQRIVEADDLASAQAGYGGGGLPRTRIESDSCSREYQIEFRAIV
jgi:hypothetical protein